MPWLASPATAQYYQWNDSAGNRVLSDRPPPAGTDFTIVNVQTGRATSPEPELESEPEAQPDGETPSPAESSAPAAPLIAKGPEKDPERCAAAEANLRDLNTYARIRMSDTDGNIRFLSEEDKEVERDKARRAIDVYCE